MKPGDKFDCSHCGQKSFLKKESVLAGWTKKGDVLKCAFCGAVIRHFDAGDEEAAKDETLHAGKDALAALLGEDGPAPSSGSGLLDEDRRFCRDCAYRITTAFRMRCSKHEKDVNPMDDCPDYTPRSN